MSDNSNLSSHFNHQWIFCENWNSSDDISLYKSTAGTSNVIIDGVNSSVASSSNNLIKIKVTRTSANLIYIRKGHDRNWVFLCFRRNGY
jgi:hypothetical protein